MASRLKKGAAITALAVSLVGGFEGLRLYTYRDVLSIPTACYGETRGIKMGMRFTKAQCDSMLVDGLEDFEAGMRRCLASPDTIPDKPYIAFLSLSYNIGVGAFCKSTVVRRANAGNLKGACEAILAFNRGGGRIIQGLVNRRKAERDLCIKGLG